MSNSCKNGMQYSTITDYRESCEYNENLFKRYGIPKAHGTMYRVFLQKNANRIRHGLMRDQQLRTENPTGCRCNISSVHPNSSSNSTTKWSDNQQTTNCGTFPFDPAVFNCHSPLWSKFAPCLKF